MLVSKVRQDGVFDGPVEVPDGTFVIPTGHTFTPPPDIPPGHHAIMRDGWVIVPGEKPEWPPRPSEAELIDRFIKEVLAGTQSRLDSFANTRGYSDIMSACSYADSTIAKFKQEALYCIEARDTTWVAAYNIINEVDKKSRPLPESFYAIESELPELSWPVTEE